MYIHLITIAWLKKEPESKFCVILGTNLVEIYNCSYAGNNLAESQQKN